MNYHSDSYIFEQLSRHYDDARANFKSDCIVGLFLQGSQNYGLDYENSDVDTKLIVLPTVEDLIYNMQPVSTTFIRENNEHIDFKDLRLYFSTFKKQNPNFIEILFTKYFYLTATYEKEWNMLVENNELISRMNPNRALKAMLGMAENKYAALKHPYEGKLDILNKFGYDPKQLHHLIRMSVFIDDFLNDVPYKDCLVSKCADYLMALKTGILKEDEATKLANSEILKIRQTVEKACDGKSHEENKEAVELINDVQYQIMYKSLRKQIE